MKRFGRRGGAYLAAAALCAVLAGCGSSSGEATAPLAASSTDSTAQSSDLSQQQVDTARAKLFEYFRDRARGEPAARPLPYDDITDLLPNVAFETRAGAAPISAAVVHGRIVDVIPNAGYKDDPASDRSVITRVDFNDPSAIWADANLVVEVLDEIGDGVPVGDTIEVRVPLNQPSDLALIRPGFVEAFESVVLFLSMGGPSPAYDESDFSIVKNGEMLTEVRDGNLSLPWTAQAVSPDYAQSLLSRAPTLGALRESAAQPREVRQPPTAGPLGP